ncbi:MAG: hypothetical protein FD180_4726 [Planctomycetota bacterium]|nr:MAG: hypothetical protein FD180_4726 [Planctomycetota bacterium]
MRTLFLFLTLSLAARAGDVLTTTVEWISLSADSQALWVEGTAPDGPLTLELRVADDPLVLATRETIASNGRFSSLLRPRSLPAAAYALDILAGRSAARAEVLSGTEEERDAYARPEAAWLGASYERIVALTDDLHRFRDESASSKNLERWRLWSPGWQARRESLSNELDEFRARRGVLANAREFYRLVSSLCFAKTLHSLYAAELHSRGGEPGGEEASDWSKALAQQLDEFREARTPVTAADIARWARDLADDDVAVRDRASRGLSRAKEAARATLRETAAGSDREAAARARELLEKLDGRK